MTTVVLVIHVMIALSLIGVVLIQKSEGGGLGVGGGGGMSGFMTGRGQANLLTRTTQILAACFMVTSVSLAVLHGRTHGVSPSLLDQIPPQTMPQPDSSTPPAPTPAAPATPDQPSTPLAK